VALGPRGGTASAHTASPFGEGASPCPTAPIPSSPALREGHERPSDAEPLVVALKRQVAIVRTLADEVERFLSSDSVARELHVQLVQELTQLASRALEAAQAWTEDGGGGR